MKKLLIVSILCITHNISGCECDLTNIERDSIFNPANISKNYPVIFTGQYIGWDYWGLRVFKVISEIKGIKNADYFTVSQHTCELQLNLGDTLLISAYHNPRHPFMSFGGCSGSYNFNNKHYNENKYVNKKNIVANLKKLVKSISKETINPRKLTAINICKKYDFTLRDSKSKIITTRDKLEGHKIEKPITKIIIKEVTNWYYIIVAICLSALTTIVFYKFSSKNQKQH